MMERTLTIDAQLLVLLVVGLVSRDFISKHKRLAAYTAEDFDLLRDLLAQHTEIVVTPNALTEASNLLGHSSEPMKSQLYAALREFISGATEDYVESRVACERHEFVRLGLSDAVSLTTAIAERTLVTSDLDLYLAAVLNGQEAINFNHLRASRETL